jgi:hypothetical protein
MLSANTQYENMTKHVLVGRFLKYLSGIEAQESKMTDQAPTGLRYLGMNSLCRVEIERFKFVTPHSMQEW